jgi:Cyclin, N-terminal domain
MHPNHRMAYNNETLKILLGQVNAVYIAQDYLAPAYQEKLSRRSEVARGGKTVGVSSVGSRSSSISSIINDTWREKICEWSYQVVDHFDFSREVVCVSMSFLDRYLSSVQVDKKLFQLAAMTTLHLAIKLFEPGTLSMQSMIELSRGYFTAQQMAAMEMKILQ